jgi:ribosomal protein S18 acetylase RimI-like enzyme
MAEEIQIARFNEADIPFGKMLTDDEGWHRSVADWKRLIAIAPYGMLKASIGNKDVGVAGLLWYDKVAWLHSVLVLKEARGRGIGRAMLKTCVQRAQQLKVPCVKLDSVRGFENFYKSFGFVEEFESRRFLRSGEHLPMTAERITPGMLDKVLYFDQVMTGLNRSRAIKALYDDAPELAFCTRTESGLRGYVLARRGDERIQIGPCVVEDQDSECARRLITSLLASKPDAKFRMCVAGSNKAAVELARDLNFDSAISSTRMFSGMKFEESKACLAMMSPEKG